MKPRLVVLTGVMPVLVIAYIVHVVSARSSTARLIEQIPDSFFGRPRISRLHRELVPILYSRNDAARHPRAHR